MTQLPEGLQTKHDMDQDAMLCGRMVKRKLNERDSGRVPLSDDSQWQDQSVLKRSKLMGESAKDDCHNDRTQPQEISRRSRGGNNLKMTGHLKLSISIDHNTLTVNVYEARQLSSRWRDVCDSHVQLLLVPDDTRESYRETTVVAGSNNPQFHETFTWNIMEEDKRKRLTVSVWHKDSQKKCSEFMGCMSFGMKHLMCKKKEKKTEGWYYLLSEKISHRKHVLAQTTDTNIGPTENVQHRMNDGISFDTFSILVRRSEAGYGFTLRGSCPTRVGRVKVGGAACVAGLQRGDYVMRANGVDVSGATAATVAHMVRHSTEAVQFHVHRGLLSDRSSLHSSYNSVSRHSQDVAMMTSRDSDEENRPPGGENVPRAINRSIPGNICSNRSNLTVSNSASRLSWQPHLSMINEEKRAGPASASSSGASSGSCSSRELVRWDPELSDISCRDSMASYVTRSSSSCLDSGLSWQQTMSDDGDGSQQTGAFSAEDEDSCNGSLEEGEGKEDWGYPPHIQSSHESRSEGIESDADQYQGRVEAVQWLYACEETFVREMQYGIQRFSRPLRHCVFSSQQHGVIFQNVEKLVAISEFHLCHMIDSRYEGDDIIVDNIGDVYHPKLRMMYEAYCSYNSGLERALETLSGLRDYDQLRQFLHTPEDELTVEDFLNRPIQHMLMLRDSLDAVLSFTPTTHSDYKRLNDVTAVITATCGRLVTFNIKRQSTSARSLESSRSSGHMITASSHSSGSSQSMLSVSSVDSEVMEIQSRLVFAPGITNFRLAKANRHVIFAGDLVWVRDATLWPISALLLSDMLVLTRQEADGRLVVLEEPVLMHDIAQSDFTSGHPAEFTLWVERSDAGSSKGDVRSITLRTSSLEQKCAWKTILEHRMKTAQREMTLWHAPDIII